MANKYKVEADGQFIGHFYGTSPEIAIRKAIAADADYHHGLVTKSGTTFVASRGSDIPYKVVMC